MLQQQTVEAGSLSLYSELWQTDRRPLLQGLPRLVPALIAAVAFNLLLFSLLAFLGSLRVETAKIHFDDSVNFIRMRPEIPPEKPEKKKVEEKKPEIPKPAVKTLEPVVKKPEFKPPKLEFDINPRLQMGMKVAAPPVLKKVKTAFEMGDVDAIPMTTMKLKPVYPYRARRTHITGAVDIRFLVDTTGSVRMLEILKAVPPKIFEDSVRQAVTRWKFQPGRKDGKPVNTWMVTTIKFELE